MQTCAKCDRLEGYVEEIDRKGVHRLRPCAHGRSGAGFERAEAILRQAGLLEVRELTPLDRRIAEILAKHCGHAQAIRSADLAALVLSGGDDPARKEELRRGITQSIERLRTVARLPVAASKESPPGYFIPQTAEEWDEMHERYMQELLRYALLARLFKPQADIVQRLRGQLGLHIVEPPAQEAAHE